MKASTINKIKKLNYESTDANVNAPKSVKFSHQVAESKLRRGMHYVIAFRFDQRSELSDKRLDEITRSWLTNWHNGIENHIREIDSTRNIGSGPFEILTVVTISKKKLRK